MCVCLFGLSLPSVVCWRASSLIYVICVCLVCLYLQLFVGGLQVLFMLCVFVWFVFTSSCLLEGFKSYLCYVCLFGLSLPPVVCRRAHVLFTLLVFVWFVFTFSCLLEGFKSYLLYLQLFVFVWFVFTSSCLLEGFKSYLCYVCLFGLSLPSVVCWRASSLIYVICVCLVCLYLQLFVGGLQVLFMLCVFVWFVFTSSCLLEGFKSYLCYVCLFGLSLPPVVCWRASSLIYVICVCLVCLYLQLFVGGLQVLFMLFVFVWFVFTFCWRASSLIYVICVCLVCLYLQLFVGGLQVLFMLCVFVWFVFTFSCLLEGFKSYLRYLCLFGLSLPPVVCRRASSLIYVICVCLVCLYLQLFVGGLLCLFGLSLPSVVCWRAQVLFMLCVFVWFVFTSSCLLEGFMSYLCYLCLFGLSLPQLFVGGLQVLFTLFVFVWFVFTSSCLLEGFKSYLRYLCLFGLSLPPVVCWRASSLIYVMCVCLVCLYLQLFVGGLQVLFTLFVFVWFVFTSSCLLEGFKSYLRYLCLFGLSLPPVVCWRASSLIYVICVCLVCLYLQLFVGGLQVLFTLCLCVCLVCLYLQLFVGGLQVLFMLFVFVWFVFTSSCLLEGCLIYVICVCLVCLYLQLFVGGLQVLFTLCVFVWFVFTSSCLLEGFKSYLRYVCLFGLSLPPVVCWRASSLIYVICVCLVCLYLQLFVGGLQVLFTLCVFVWFVFTSSCLLEGFKSYLRYVCLFGLSLPPVVCWRASSLIYVICVCLVCLYLQLFVGGLQVLFTLCVFVWFVFTCLYLQLFVGGLQVLFTLCVFVWFVFTSSCLLEGFKSYLRYVCLFGLSLPPVVCWRASSLIYVICVCLVCLYLQLFVGGLQVLFTLFVFVCA